MVQYILDRIGDGVAVCEREDGGHERFPAEIMPLFVREGDCLCRADGSSVFLIDRAETERRRAFSRNRLRGLLDKQ